MLRRKRFHRGDAWHRILICFAIAELGLVPRISCKLLAVSCDHNGACLRRGDIIDCTMYYADLSAYFCFISTLPDWLKSFLALSSLCTFCFMYLTPVSKHSFYLAFLIRFFLLTLRSEHRRRIKTVQNYRLSFRMSSEIASGPGQSIASQDALLLSLPCNVRLRALPRKCDVLD